MSSKKTNPTAPTEAAPATVKVILDPKDRPGVRACGPYLPGRVYEVPAELAKHLTTNKGFRQATEGECCTPAKPAATPTRAAKRQARRTPATAG